MDNIENILEGVAKQIKQTDNLPKAIILPDDATTEEAVALYMHLLNTDNGTPITECTIKNYYDREDK